MKSTLFIVAAAMLLSSVGFAKDSLDGCGLGWEVTDKKSYTGTTTRATTNWVIPPTFGMTTGTMGCDKLDVGQNNREAMNYVATNFEVLKTELAMGQGEYVNGLVKTMGCSADAGSRIQNAYDTVVAPAADAKALYTNLRTVCI